MFNLRLFKYSGLCGVKHKTRFQINPRLNHPQGEVPDPSQKHKKIKIIFSNFFLFDIYSYQVRRALKICSGATMKPLLKY